MRRFGVLGVVAMLVGASVVEAGHRKPDPSREPKDPEARVHLVGKVSVVKQGRRIESVTVAAKSSDGEMRVYKILPSGPGRDLARNMDGLPAEIKGTLTTRRDETLLRVAASRCPELTGTVSVEKDEKDAKAVRVRFVAENGLGEYNVHYSGRGRTMAERMAGQTVRIKRWRPYRRRDTPYIRVVAYEKVGSGKDRTEPDRKRKGED
jgi:hypothetical protein